MKQKQGNQYTVFTMSDMVKRWGDNLTDLNNCAKWHNVQFPHKQTGLVSKKNKH